MDSTGEPSPKRLRTDDSELTVDQTQSIKVRMLQQHAQHMHSQI